MRKNLNGNEAFAHGTLEAGVKVVASYPGTPASGLIESLLPLTLPEEVYVEWSTNEKVALEVGIGASLAGRRALVCVKSVGMNVIVDTLMTLNLTGVNAGLVILLGDDPGAYGSQNDQDSRPMATYAEIPLLEPSTPEEAKTMLLEAYDLSERFGTAVIVRETRSFSQKTGFVECPGPKARATLPWVREPCRWFSYPKNAVAMHRALHEKLGELRSWANDSAFNRSEGEGKRGIVGVGFAHDKLLDVLSETHSELRLLKLGTLYPSPDKVIADFLAHCDEVLVFEENEPYLEREIQAIANDHGLTTRVVGKLSGHVPREGELYRWQIQESLSGFVDDFRPARTFAQADEADEKPSRKDNCAGCPFPEIVETLKDVGRELGMDPVLLTDPGCLVKAASLVDAKWAMGSAVAVAQGMTRADYPERALALFGDSSFFHMALPGLINAVYNQTPILMIVFDNSSTVTSGFQPNPGSGQDAFGRAAPKLSIEAIASACGVGFVRTVGPESGDKELRVTFREGLKDHGIGLIVVRKPCRSPE